MVALNAFPDAQRNLSEWSEVHEVTQADFKVSAPESERGGLKETCRSCELDGILSRHLRRQMHTSLKHMDAVRTDD